jgi:hypothetical protein
VTQVMDLTHQAASNRRPGSSCRRASMTSFELRLQRARIVGAAHPPGQQAECETPGANAQSDSVRPAATASRVPRRRRARSCGPGRYEAICAIFQSRLTRAACSSSRWWGIFRGGGHRRGSGRQECPRCEDATPASAAPDCRLMLPRLAPSDDPAGPSLVQHLSGTRPIPACWTQPSGGQAWEPVPASRGPKSRRSRPRLFNAPSRRG